MKGRIDVSVVVPVFNEEESVILLCEKIQHACQKLGLPYEIIFIDDGSQDHTFDLLHEVHCRDKTVKVVRFRKNYGQTAAMAAGFRAAKGEIVVSMDGDLQNDPADIPNLLHKLQEGFDVVCGWRKDRKDKLISRRIPSMIANWLIGKITGVPIHDNGCSLKAYRKDVIKRVALYSELHRFIPAMSTLTGARITEMVVNHHARQFGKSKYGISRAWKVFSDLFVIKMLTGFSVKPALWFGGLSLGIGALGVVGLVLLSAVGSSGVVIPTVIFLIFALFGHLMFMGMLGEVLVRTGDYQPWRMIAKSTVKVRTCKDRS